MKKVEGADIEDEILVSVCVITYNSIRFIEETLNSIKRQTYGKIELIISDDHSTDGTIEFCEKWIEHNNSRFVRTVLLVSNENHGISANANKAFYVAHGEWIKGLAGDDVLVLDCIEKNIRYVTTNPYIQILHSYNLYIDAQSNLLGESLFKKDRTFFSSSAEKQFSILLRKYVGNTVSCFIKRSLFLRVGGYDEDIKMMEDYPMWLKCTQNGAKIYFMDDLTTYYRVHDTSIMHGGGQQRSKLLPSIVLYTVKVREKYAIPHLGKVEKIALRISNRLVIRFFHSKFNSKSILNEILYIILKSPFVLLNRIILFRLYSHV